MALFNAKPVSRTPSFDRLSIKFFTCKERGIETPFFTGDTMTTFTEEMLECNTVPKRPTTIESLLRPAKYLGHLAPPRRLSNISIMLAVMDFDISVAIARLWRMKRL